MLDALLKTGNPILILGAVVFMAGTLWANFHYMRKNMITKKDLELTFAKFTIAFSKEMEEKFVTKEMFGAIVSQEKPNGHAKANAR